MHLVAFAADGFRNLDRFRLSPDRRFNIFEGDNGQGKTNLLEAVYLLSAFRSFRDAQNRQLVGWDREEATVFGEIVRREVSRTVEVSVSPKGKRVTLDGKAITKLPASFAHLNVVLFGPDDLALTKAGPDVRRRWLDRAVFTIWPDYLADARAYRAALKSRNELLRRHRGGPPPASMDAVLSAFEKELATRAARVLSRRMAFLDGFQPAFSSVFDEITAGALSGAIRYRGYKGLGRDAADLAGIEAGYRAALDQARETDFRRGYTGVGPHADDLLFTIDKRSTRIYASQGQHRAFVLALKIAELQRIHDSIGVYPLFLLDDVSSELDETRNALLMRYLDRAGGQVFITTTDRRWIQVEGATRVFRVASGVVTPMPD